MREPITEAQSIRILRVLVGTECVLFSIHFLDWILFSISWSTEVVSDLLWGGISFVALGFLLLKVWERRNWARRLYLLGTGLMFGIVPFILVPPMEGMRSLWRGLPVVISVPVDIINILVTFGVILFLLSEPGRRLFTDKKPRTLHRALLYGTFAASMVGGLLVYVGVVKMRPYLEIENRDIRLNERGRELHDRAMQSATENKEEERWVR